MNAPTHIRFTHDESLAIDAYAEAHGLRKASAVRELLRLGLAATQQPAPQAVNADPPIAAKLNAMTVALNALARAHDDAARRLDAGLQLQTDTHEYVRAQLHVQQQTQKQMQRQLQKLERIGRRRPAPR